MSDIPPELLEDQKPAKRKAYVEPDWAAIYAADRRFMRRLVICSCIALLLLIWASFSNAATLDRTDVYCELFEQDQTNFRYYIAADPPWTPECANPWVTLRKEKFQTLVDAYEGGSGSSATPQFTADEVAALKYQAANPSPFNLSVEDGAYISAVIGGVWALAWGWKQLGLFASDDRSFD